MSCVACARNPDPKRGRNISKIKRSQRPKPKNTQEGVRTVNTAFARSTHEIISAGTPQRQTRNDKKRSNNTNARRGAHASSSTCLRHGRRVGHVGRRIDLDQPRLVPARAASVTRTAIRAEHIPKTRQYRGRISRINATKYIQHAHIPVKSAKKWRPRLPKKRYNKENTACIYQIYISNNADIWRAHIQNINIYRTTLIYGGRISRQRTYAESMTKSYPKSSKEPRRLSTMSCADCGTAGTDRQWEKCTPPFAPHGRGARAAIRATRGVLFAATRAHTCSDHTTMRFICG